MPAMHGALRGGNSWRHPVGAGLFTTETRRRGVMDTK